MMELMGSWSAFSENSSNDYYDYPHELSLPRLQRSGRDVSSFSVFAASLAGDGEESSIEDDTNSTRYFPAEMENETSSLGEFPNFADDAGEYIFDRSDVRITLLVLYTIVFALCFVGNLMVILVVTLHWRMRSITNFCLANLAFADLCVGIFCVYQNIVTYLMESWVFGEFMCKMYHFINSLSTTASVLILVVICIERYLAIIHPMTCRQMLTLNRLRATIVIVWILSAAISAPRFYYISTLSMPLPNDQYEIICSPNRQKYDSKLMDMLSMTVLFLIPLGIISVLYTQIGIVLWKTSNTKMPAASASVESSTSSGCYYQEADNNIIQTVNLTLLPLTEQVQQDNMQPHRPTCLHGISVQSSPPEKRSFLSSHLICVNCRGGKAKSKQRSRAGKKKMHVCRAATIRTSATSQHHPCNNTTEATTNNRPCLTRNIPLDSGNNCPCSSTITKSHNHHDGYHYSGSLEENMEVPTGGGFIHHCHGGCAPLANISPELSLADGEATLDKNGQALRREGSTSPSTTTCCGGRLRGGNSSSCLNGLRRKGHDKSANFSTPPSPFCSRHCLEGKGSKTDPIVVVKFEKDNGSTRKKKGRRSQCTILMNPKTHGVEGNYNASGEKRMSCNGSAVHQMSEQDQPQTLYGCTICHPQGNFECHDGSSMKCDPSRDIIRGECECHGGESGFLRKQVRAISVDSGMARSTPTRGSMERGFSVEHNFERFNSIGPPTTATVHGCPSCGGGGVGGNVQGSPPRVSCNGPLPGNHTPSAPQPAKRLRRLRVVRSSKYGTGALRRRRKIIKMLIVIVLTFTICHLPFHARKVWQYWSPKWFKYQGGSAFSTLLTPITFLIMFANSAINPILYAFMSNKFKMSIKDLLCCKMKDSLKFSRNPSVRERSTHAVALSQTGC